MPGVLEGRVAAITGTSSGIGAATAVTLAREGATVALGGRRTDRLEELAKSIVDDGGRAVPIEVDVTDEAQARAFIERAREEGGSLDVLVNNAGVMLLGPVEGADVGEWRRMVDVNVMGLLYCTHAALPLLRASGGGDIVNISSVAGRTASAGAAVYNLTKFGVSGFSEALRQEALHGGVRVTCVEPGYVETELQGHNKNPVVQRTIARSHDEIGDVLRPGDVADAILYAVSRPRRVGVNEMLVRPAGQRR